MSQLGGTLPRGSLPSVTPTAQQGGALVVFEQWPDKSSSRATGNSSQKASMSIMAIFRQQPQRGGKSRAGRAF